MINIISRSWDNVNSTLFMYNYNLPQPQSNNNEMLNNFFSINAIDLKLYDFSYKSILHLLAKLRYPTYCQSENIGHNLKPPIQFFWKN